IAAFSSPTLRLFLISCPGDDRPLHSFPTRRSSDLIDQILAKKLLAAAADTGARTICLAGGVAANGRLRQLVNDGAQKLGARIYRSEEHTSELQSRFDLVCRLLLEKKKIPETHGSEV